MSVDWPLDDTEIGPRTQTGKRALGMDLVLFLVFRPCPVPGWILSEGKAMKVPVQPSLLLQGARGWPA